MEASYRAGVAGIVQKYRYPKISFFEPIIAINSIDLLLESSHMRHAIGRLCGSFISTAVKRSAFLLPTTTARHQLSSTQSNLSMSTQLWQQLTTQLKEKIKNEDDRYRKASERSWEINSALVRSNFAYDSGGLDSQSIADDTLDKLVKDTVSCTDMYNNIVHDNGEGDIIKVHERAPRLGGLSNKMEDYARVSCVNM